MSDQTTHAPTTDQTAEAPAPASDEAPAVEQPTPASEETTEQDTREAQDVPESSTDERVAETIKESAKYRKRAQAAEQALATAVAQRDAANRQLIDNLTGTTGVKISENAGPSRLRHPSDLYTLGGVTTADLTNDDGSIDTEKITATMTTLAQERPELFHGQAVGRAPMPDWTQGAVLPTGGQPASWETFLRR